MTTGWCKDKLALGDIDKRSLLAFVDHMFIHGSIMRVHTKFLNMQILFNFCKVLYNIGL